MSMTTRMVEHMGPNMGSLLSGAIASAVFLGVSLAQTFYYYTTYPKDKLYLKSLVAATAVLNTVHQIMVSHMIWHYLVTNFYKPENIKLVIWSVIMQALCTIITGALVQSFYVMRVRLLCKSKVLTGCIALLTFTSAGFGLAWVVRAMQQKTFADLFEISWLTISVDCLSSVTNVLIAAALCIMLRQGRIAFNQSDGVINKLMALTLNTGVLTSCCSLTALLILAASPLTLVHAPFYFCLGRLYTNSLLATLNARDLNKKAKGNSHVLVTIPQTRFNSDHPGHEKTQQSGIEIRIERTQTRDQPGDEPTEKVRGDDELVNRHDSPSRSIKKERESQEYASV
ncbi:hypothetical protein LshimejAT787_0905540 [Lyophyllum shimeji]|uniref:DUF6534 domain-containing protein n=1 Tax=Lyophyllum shimeji TaxID=47721 RepID=A0A9P3PTP7_LYOSH|nr:hypothetical protein LshimejAT787_0905540 [Lyophyllum shimeji]